MESLVAWMRRRHGEPTSILQRRAQVFSKGRVDNPTIVWELPDPTTGEHRILEIRRFDDTRGGFPDTRHGVILLHDQAAESVFPRLSSVEVMALRIADPRDGDTGQDSAAKNSPYPSLYPAKTASPSRKEANRGPRLPKTAPRPPPAPPPVLSGPNPFDPDTKTASPLPTIGPVEESR